MTARFGRNKRRRAREEMAQVQEQLAHAESEKARFEKAYAMANGLSRHLAQKNDELNTVIDDVRAELPSNTSLLPPEKLSMPHHDLRRDGPIRMPVEQPLMSWSDLDSSEATMSLSIQAEDLHPLDVRVEDDRMLHKLHALIEFASGRVAYSASLEAIRGMPRDRFVRMVSRQVAEALEIDLRKRGMR